MLVHVGLTNLLGSIERYAERFDLLELRAEPGRLPNAKALRKLRAQAPDELVFSLLVPPNVSATMLEHPEQSAELLESAEILRAAWVVVQTGPTFGPSARSRARLEALAARVNKTGRRMAWEPRGPWEPEVARAMAAEHSIVLVEDLSVVDAPTSGLVYTRLRVLGPGAELRSSALAALAERLADAEEACIVIEGRGSPKARARIEQALGAAANEREHEGEDLEEEDLPGAPRAGSSNGLEQHDADDEDLDGEDSDGEEVGDFDDEDDLDGDDLDDDEDDADDEDPEGKN